MIRRIFISSLTVKAAAAAAPTTTFSSLLLVAAQRRITYAPKPDDHDRKLALQKKTTWNYEKKNGTMSPHRYYSYDPCSWNRAAAEKMENGAGVGPDKLPIVEKAELERGRERERQRAMDAMMMQQQQYDGDDHHSYRGGASYAITSSSNSNQMLPNFPTLATTPVASFSPGVDSEPNKKGHSSDAVAASSPSDSSSPAERSNNNDNNSNRSTFEICQELSGAAWDLLRRLLRPSAAFLGKRAKATALVDFNQTALLLQDAVLLLVAEQESSANCASSASVLRLLADSWLALHFAAKAAPASASSSPSSSRNGEILSLETQSKLESHFAASVAAVAHRHLDFRTRAILMTMKAAAAAVCVADSPQLSSSLLAELVEFARDPQTLDEFAQADNIDVTSLFIPQFLSSAVIAARRCEEVSASSAAAAGEEVFDAADDVIARIAVALDFAAARFAARVVNAHNHFQRTTADRGLGKTPVDSIALRWLVSAVGDLSSYYSSNEETSQAKKNLASRLQRITTDSLDQILYLTPNRDVPLRQLISAASAPLYYSCAAASTEPASSSTTTTAAMQLLCVGVVRRFKLDSLAVLPFEELSSLLKLLAQPAVMEKCSLLADDDDDDDGDDDDAGHSAPSRGDKAVKAGSNSISLRNEITRADYGALTRNVLHSLFASSNAVSSRVVAENGTGGKKSSSNSNNNSGAHSSVFVEVCSVVSDISTIAAFYPSFRLDVALWRDIVNSVAAAKLLSEAQNEAQGSEMEEQQLVQQVRQQLMLLRQQHCVDAGGNGKPVAIPMTKKEYEFVSRVFS